jgi:hypothetical protein
MVFNWDQSQQPNPTVMIPQNQGLCWLTRVVGHYAGAGEQVYVTGSNGYWVLTGSSQQNNVGGSATCRYWSDLTREPSIAWGWDMWTVATNCPSCRFPGFHPADKQWWDDTSLCMLGGVKGIFNGPGEVAEVYLNGSDLHWHGYSDDNTGANETDSDAICAWFGQQWGALNFGAEYTWTQDTGASIDMGPSTNQICVLEEVTGRFMGWGEWVQIRESTGFNPHWYLEGSSLQIGVAAKARCLPTPVRG